LIERRFSSCTSAASFFDPRNQVSRLQKTGPDDGVEFYGVLICHGDIFRTRSSSKPSRTAVIVMILCRFGRRHIPASPELGSAVVFRVPSVAVGADLADPVVVGTALLVEAGANVGAHPDHLLHGILVGRRVERLVVHGPVGADERHHVLTAAVILGVRGWRERFLAESGQGRG
jgi:hypothetical protein